MINLYFRLIPLFPCVFIFCLKFDRQMCINQETGKGPIGACESYLNFILNITLFKSHTPQCTCHPRSWGGGR